MLPTSRYPIALRRGHIVYILMYNVAYTHQICTYYDGYDIESASGRISLNFHGQELFLEIGFL